MNQIYQYLNISRQSFHQMVNRRMLKEQEQQQIVYLVRQVRR